MFVGLFLTDSSDLNPNIMVKCHTVILTNTGTYFIVFILQLLFYTESILCPVNVYSENILLLLHKSKMPPSDKLS